PGVAETLDWANSLTQLDVVALTPEIINDTLGALLKYQDDIIKVRGSEAARLLAEIQSAA
ncbi:MAG: MoxR family ATPase, partial [Gammaproteobacteria bacterium]